MEEFVKKQYIENIMSLEKNTYCLFDGVNFAVGESYRPFLAMENIQNMNINAELMSIGTGVTLFELEILFSNFIIGKNDILTWYYLDSHYGDLLINLVSDNIKFDDVINSDKYSKDYPELNC